jgi:hypothetical protein
MVMSFHAATVGLEPVFDPKNPLSLGPQTIAVYLGKAAGAGLDIDKGQIHAACVNGHLTVDTAVKSLCGMLMNTAWAVAEPNRKRTPDFEVFRHVRNAVSHGNKFNFEKWEPRWPAAWKGLTIDHTKKGPATPLYGVECSGATLLPADAIWLLHDVEAQLP